VEVKTSVLADKDRGKGWLGGPGKWGLKRRLIRKRKGTPLPPRRWAFWGLVSKRRVLERIDFKKHQNS